MKLFLLFCKLNSSLNLALLLSILFIFKPDLIDCNIGIKCLLFSLFLILSFNSLILSSYELYNCVIFIDFVLIDLKIPKIKSVLYSLINSLYCLFKKSEIKSSFKSYKRTIFPVKLYIMLISVNSSSL